MELTDVFLHTLRMPLVSPFRTSYGIETSRQAVLVQVVGPDVEGWGECVAEAEPLYTEEYSDSACHVITEFLVPRLSARPVEASGLSALFAPVKGNRMAKGGLEAAMLDAECRRDGRSFGQRLGAVHDRVPAGVSVGIHESIPALLDTVAGYLGDGYRRVKLKIEPGNDIAQVAAVRERFGPIALQVDANSAYTLADAAHLRALDNFDLLMIEQPLAQDDLTGHAELAKLICTPICLDESITSLASAHDAIVLGACSIVNIKAGRVGGYLEAVKIHDLCQRRSVPVWCGGMLETGIGRAANVALAALPGFTLPGDTSASRRYFHRDVTDAFVLDDGHLRVPSGPGIGVSPIPEALAEFRTSLRRIAV